MPTKFPQKNQPLMVGFFMAGIWLGKNRGKTGEKPRFRIWHLPLLTNYLLSPQNIKLSNYCCPHFRPLNIRRLIHIYTSQQYSVFSPFE
ncbi:hypothetical protein C6H68_17835 [Photorhabdus luminescens]|nr:hypothetical protein C6H68_17835 [Photorhabdus luminescens]